LLKNTLITFTMKKLLTIALCMVLFTTAKSQVYLQGGVNLSNITTLQSRGTQSNSPLTTFNVGILDRLKIVGLLDFETGLLVDGRGAKSKININGEDYYTAKFNPFYVEVPANLVLRLPFPAKAKIFLNAGPYIAMGIAGQTRIDGNIGGVTLGSTADIKFNNSNPNENNVAYSQLNLIDYGLNIGGGFDFRNVFLKINYEMGFAKVNATQIDNFSNDSNKYQIVNISLGFPLSDFYKNSNKKS